MAQKLETVQKNIAKIEAWIEKKNVLINKKLATVQKAGYAIGETAENLFNSNGREIRFIDKELHRMQDNTEKDAIVNAMWALASSSVPSDMDSKKRELKRLKATEAEMLETESGLTPEQKAEKAKREAEKAMRAYIRSELDNIKIPALDAWLDRYKEAYIESANRYLKGWQLSSALQNVNQAVRDQKMNIIIRSFEKVGKLTDISFGKIGLDGSYNGTVTGENGSARIQTILAGGYNIQCLHYRVLVH